jgi:hypothetical protein
MYVSSGSACTERNSQTPMDPRAIARQDARVARMGNRFVRGNVTLNTLVQTLGGVGIGDDVPGVTELAAAADFRNSPGCSTSISAGGGLYGGRIASGSQAPGINEGGAYLPLSLGGNVMGSPAVPGSPAVTQAQSDAGASLAAIAAAGGDPAAIAAAAGTPASAPGASSFSGPAGAYNWWQNRRGGRACSVPQILPLMTVFPIGSIGSETQAAAVATAAPSMRDLLLVALGGVALWAVLSSGKG